ncbi:hypothetical protein CapIbe_003710 [Capra ibex]
MDFGQPLASCSLRVSSMMVEMPGLVRTDSQCAPSRQRVKPIPRTCNETNKKTIAVSGRGRSTITWN